MFKRNKNKNNKVNINTNLNLPEDNKAKVNKEDNKKFKVKKKSKLAEKLDMYDMILANLYAGSSIIDIDRTLDRSHIDIGFSNITSEKLVIKYFLIDSLPDWLVQNLFTEIREQCLLPGVRINFSIYGEPHKINWDSPEMKNRMTIWKSFSEAEESSSAFDYRRKRGEILARKRIVDSTSYLNEAELDQKRSLIKASFIIEMACQRDDESLMNMDESILKLKRLCKGNDIRIMELRVNLIDWIQQLGMMSLRSIKEVYRRITKKILTDDILANFNSYRQGRIGDKGTPLGIDVLSNVPVLKQFKENPDEPENVLICGGTGSGKSMFIKNLLTWLLKDFVVTVLDYEGDEYTNIENFIYDGGSKDAVRVSMGNGDSCYFDPMQIGDLTGEPEIDNSLKKLAIDCILSTFKLLISGGNELTKWESSVLNEAIKRVYEDHGVTDNEETWKKSKGLNIKMIYEELCDMVVSQEFLDDNMDDVKHKAAVNIVESCNQYFEDGGIKSDVFKNPINIEDLKNCRLIVFSFGQNGAAASQTDPTVLALKQLSVSNLTIQISNYCKYYRHCCNVKIWEEYQRWGDIKGSEEIIGNAITGGRKRGDLNFIITNDLNAILDDDIKINTKIRDNLTGYIVGYIPDSRVRDKFCDELNLDEMRQPLKLIYTEGSKKYNKKKKKFYLENRYKHAFCVIMLNSGEKAIVKAMVPQEILNSKLFRTGVDISKREN